MLTLVQICQDEFCFLNIQLHVLRAFFEAVKVKMCHFRICRHLFAFVYMKLSQGECIVDQKLIFIYDKTKSNQGRFQS